MLFSDSKSYSTGMADTKQLLKHIQSVPSKKAELFKIWLTKVGNNHIDKSENPKLLIDRTMCIYLQKS